MQQMQQMGMGFPGMQMQQQGGMPQAPSAPVAPSAPAAPAAPAVNGGTNFQTLYVNNLNDKIKCDDLKIKLKEVFQAFGSILDIICMKSLRRRGQAWVIFAKEASAKKALESLQGFPLYNKPMRLAYSATTSDIVAKANGTYVPRPKIKKGVKRQRAADGPVAAAPAPVPQADNVSTVPTNMLFIENLPEGVTDQMIKMLFMQYPGFASARLVPGRNVGFVDFQQEMNAAMALQALQGFAITPTNKLKISFGRK